MARWSACATWRASRWVPAAMRCAPSSTIRMRSGSVSSSHPALTPSICRTRYAQNGRAGHPLPGNMQWAAPCDPTVFVRDSIRAVVQTLLEAVVLVVLVVILFLQTGARRLSADRCAGIGGGYLQHSLSAGLLAEYPEPVRAGTGYRYRGGRRHRSGGERRA